MQSALTVRDLTEIPYLRTRVIAGEGGIDRQISWAHSVEIDSPWEWLQEGDLLMTTGLNIPAEAERQRMFIEKASEARLSGIALGENMNAPPLSGEMLREADARALPLLLTAFEVPFVQLSRAVATTAQRQEQRRLVQAARIYDAAREAAAHGEGGTAVMNRLSRVLGYPLFVCEIEGDLPPALPGGMALPGAVRETIKRELAGRKEGLPGFLRAEVSGLSVVAVPIPTPRARLLLTWSETEAKESLPLALLQHVATVAALEVERIDAARAARRRAGSELLAALLESRIDAAAAASRLADQGIEGDRFQALFVSCNGSGSPSELAAALSRGAVEHLSCVREGALQVLVEADEEGLERLVATLGPGVTVGVSDPFTTLDAVPEAVREARWAAELAATDGLSLLRYGERTGIFGPRSLREARTAVERVLGPVRAYDSENETELLRSLAVFLRCNRSWKKASEELMVHKQTLVYRIRRFEELSNRRLDNTRDVAELWFAVSAAESLGLIGSGRAGLEVA